MEPSLVGLETDVSLYAEIETETGVNNDGAGPDIGDTDDIMDTDIQELEAWTKKMTHDGNIPLDPGQYAQYAQGEKSIDLKAFGVQIDVDSYGDMDMDMGNENQVLVLVVEDNDN